ncbi:MAG: MFS transporter [Reyranellales bacterium]
MKRSSAARVIGAGIIGNMLEWYDFSIYGYFAGSIGRTFFPATDPVAQVLAAFGIFAVGYVMRPLGGALTGHIGDRFGRRTALTFSVTAMAVPTFLVGVLPGYAVLGAAAPILLTLLRMIQGLSVGGEYTTAMIFLVEGAPAGRRGLLGAVAACGSCGGILLGSATGAVIAAFLPPDVVTNWAWRVPFLLGLLVGLVGYLLRRHLHETPIRVEGRSPLVETAQRHLPLLARLAGLSVFNAVPFYIVFLYVVSWLQSVDGIAPARALEINTGCMVALIPVVLAAGWLSDRIGRNRLAGGALILGLIAAWPLFWLMHHPNPALILLGQLGFVLIVGVYGGVQPAALVEAAPLRVRCSVVALGYNVTVGVIGGLTPLAAAWLIRRTGNDFSPAYMIMAAAAISLCALFFQRETYLETLQTASDVPVPAPA